MRELAELNGIPTDTVLRWSKEDAWGDAKLSAVQTAGQIVTKKAGEWIAKQQAGQIRRGVIRARIGQREIDRVRRRSGNTLEMKDLRDMAAAEKDFDMQVRRNLGMEDQGAGGMSVSLRVVGNCQVNAG